MVDWTFAANDLDVYVTPATCSFEQLIADQCSVLGFSESVTAKPERVRITNLAAGNYILWVANAGPGDDRLSYQVILTENGGRRRGPIRRGGQPGARAPSGVRQGPPEGRARASLKPRGATGASPTPPS